MLKKFIIIRAKYYKNLYYTFQDVEIWLAGITVEVFLPASTRGRANIKTVLWNNYMQITYS
jgi:hypothetical protein